MPLLSALQMPTVPWGDQPPEDAARWRLSEFSATARSLGPRGTRPHTVQTGWSGPAQLRFPRSSNGPKGWISVIPFTQVLASDFGNKGPAVSPERILRGKVLPCWCRGMSDRRALMVMSCVSTGRAKLLLHHLTPVFQPVNEMLPHFKDEETVAQRLRLTRLNPTANFNEGVQCVTSF